MKRRSESNNNNNNNNNNNDNNNGNEINFASQELSTQPVTLQRQRSSSSKSCRKRKVPMDNILNSCNNSTTTSNSTSTNTTSITNTTNTDNTSSSSNHCKHMKLISLLFTRYNTHLQMNNNIINSTPKINIIEERTFTYDNSYSIISSLVFSPDGCLFAAGGINKEVKIYNWNRCVHSHGELNNFAPIAQFKNPSKVSCLTFSPNTDDIYVSSYDGCIRKFNINHCGNNNNINNNNGDDGEPIFWHEKRVWSIDMHNNRPYLLASGSDDWKVVLTDVRYSKGRFPCKLIKAGNSTSCVKFRTENEICFACADHSVQLYDLRNISTPLMNAKEHTKAVSYVALCDEDSIISASIDSTLRRWDPEGQCLRVYSGHLNSRNFTGLSCTRQYIAVGSEDDKVYIYHKDYSTPCGTYSFCRSTQQAFTASLTFHRDEQYLLAANSTGKIAALQVNNFIL